MTKSGVTPDGLNFMGESGFDPGMFAKATAISSLMNGVVADIAGGNFGHGFLNGFVNIAAVGPLGIATGKNYGLGVVAAATVGGTVSAATGGKFANGAYSAAFAAAMSIGIQKL